MLLVSVQELHDLVHLGFHLLYVILDLLKLAGLPKELVRRLIFMIQHLSFLEIDFTLDAFKVLLLLVFVVLDGLNKIIELLFKFLLNFGNPVSYEGAKTIALFHV